MKAMKINYYDQSDCKLLMYLYINNLKNVIGTMALNSNLILPKKIPSIFKLSNYI